MDGAQGVTITLPWPPSVNHYWQRNRNGSMRISAAGELFRQQVWLKCRQGRIRSLQGALWVEVKASPPDNRRRDLDNVLKAILDALQHGGAYQDDSQVWRLVIERGETVKGGAITVSLGLLRS